MDVDITKLNLDDGNTLNGNNIDTIDNNFQNIKNVFNDTNIPTHTSHLINDSDFVTSVELSESTLNKIEEFNTNYTNMGTGLNWQPEVATYSDIATTYPTPEKTWTVKVNDTGSVYRYNGTEWKLIDSGFIPEATTTNSGLMTSEMVSQVNKIGDLTGLSHTNLTDEVKQINASLSDIANNFANSKNPILIPTYDGSYQAMHPKVLYFADGWGTGGYNYWMAMTPYTNMDDQYENPSIVASYTGREFVVPSGLTNPIDKPSDTDIIAGAHMSDPHLVMVGNVMELWYRYNPGNGDGTVNNDIEKIYKRTSTDGITWSNSTLVFETTNTQTLSPVIIYEDGKYKMWFIRDADMYYMESLDSFTWNTPVKCNVPRDNYCLWHLDIIKTNLGYECVVCGYEDGATGLLRPKYLFYTSSTDGITWIKIEMIMKPGFEWDASEIYRSSILKIDNIYKIYYSASVNTQWHTGLTEGYSINALMGYDLNTFSENANFMRKVNIRGDLNLVNDTNLNVGATTPSKLTKDGLFFNDNATSFQRNLISIVNQGVAGAKLTTGTDLDTIVIKNDKNTGYGKLEVDSIVLMHTLVALVKEGSIAYSSSNGTLQICDGTTWNDLICSGKSSSINLVSSRANVWIKASQTNVATLELFKNDLSAHANMKLNSIKLTADLEAIAEEGTLAWNKNTKKPMYYNGTAWVDIG